MPSHADIRLGLVWLLVLALWGAIRGLNASDGAICSTLAAVIFLLAPPEDKQQHHHASAVSNRLRRGIALGACALLFMVSSFVISKMMARVFNEQCSVEIARLVYEMSLLALVQGILVYLIVHGVLTHKEEEATIL